MLLPRYSTDCLKEGAFNYDEDASVISRFPPSYRSQKPGRDEILFYEGESATSFYRVADGIIRLEKFTVDGRRQIVGFKFAGDFFGIGVDRYGRYRENAQAAAPSEVHRYAQSDLYRYLETDTGMGQALRRGLDEELAAAKDLCVLLGLKTAQEKVATFLLAFAARQAGLGGNPDCIDLLIGRSDIADYLGMRTETVSRVLRQLVDDGIIARPRLRRILLLNVPLLRDIAAGPQAPEEESA